MQYTKPMIELVFEIRRRVPTELKPAVKLANPELLDELVSHHPKSRDVVCQTLIKELLHLAGTPWSHALTDAQPQPPTQPRQVTKVYRGQVALEPAPSASSSDEDTTPRPKRVYRGQRVE